MPPRKNKNRQPFVENNEKIGEEVSGEIISIINIAGSIFMKLDLFISGLSTIGV